MFYKFLLTSTLFAFTGSISFTHWNPQYNIPVSKTDSDTVVLVGVGDIMMGTNYPDPKLPPSEGNQLFSNVKNFLSDADVTMGNLEGVLLNEGGTPKTCRNPKVCYVFRTPERYAANLAEAGFDVMSVANNHAGDFGDAGVRSTMRSLDKVGLLYAGQVTKPYTTFEKNGLKYGFIAFAPNTGCVNINDIEAARKIVAHLDSLCDIVMVSFHGGGEGADFQHVTQKNEIFYGENRGNVLAFAHAVIDAGADVVFGHGPHVVRAVEVYKQRFIAYSLGNFCTYGGINVAGINGFAPAIKVYARPDGTFIQARIGAGIQHFMMPVEWDVQKQAIDKIRELTRQDFPAGSLQIDGEGWIRN